MPGCSYAWAHEGIWHYPEYCGKILLDRVALCHLICTKLARFSRTHAVQIAVQKKASGASVTIALPTSQKPGILGFHRTSWIFRKRLFRKNCLFFFLTVWKTYRQHRCGNWAITQNLTSSCHSKADALWINWVWHIAWACRRVETAKAPRFSANQSWIKYPELSGHIRTSLKFWTSKTVSTLSPTCNKFASTCKHESPFGGFLVSWNQLNAKMLTGSGVHMLCLCFYMPAVNDSGLWYLGSIPIPCPYCLYAGHWAV